ncbi:MAG: hypothetical protein ACKVP1_17605 [Burkholderiaceae bacterium]
MSAAPPDRYRFLPTLTEVLQPAPEGVGAAPSLDHADLERRLREAVAAEVAQQCDAMAGRWRAELEAMVRALVDERLAAEVAARPDPNGGTAR